MSKHVPARFRRVSPGEFESERHYYSRVLNAHIHPLVRYFFSLGRAQVLERYCHLHPEVEGKAVARLVGTEPKYFRWAGADLFVVTTERGVRQTVLIETNSSPSGQKSMPMLEEGHEQSGYRRLLENAFCPQIRRHRMPGGLAVLWDKNEMEASGYAAVLADIMEEPVALVRCDVDDPSPGYRFTEDGLLEVREGKGEWEPIRAAIRYVTQRPWTRIPPVPRTLMFNPVIACLAGGRNKALAAKAYDLFNAELQPVGLSIRMPETIWDVDKASVPLWVARMGGVAVVKVPYSNAGQGVYTVTNEDELAAFMDAEHRYGRFIVQALIGNAGWSSRTHAGRLVHVGTIPDARTRIYAADIRFMVGAGPDGFFPVAIYARRARKPLAAKLDRGVSSWDMLGTNLSVKEDSGAWATESERLLLMDSRDFNRLGLGLDDLIEAYVQTVLATLAIDRMAGRLVNSKGRFRRKMFASINSDAILSGEIA